MSESKSECEHVWSRLSGRLWCPKCGADGGPELVEIKPEPALVVIKGAELSTFLDELYKSAFGGTRGEAEAERVCVVCHQHPTFTTDAGRREYEISGVCEPCFDAMFGDEDDEGY